MKPLFACLGFLLFATTAFDQNDELIVVSSEKLVIRFNTEVKIPVCVVPLPPKPLTTISSASGGTYTFDNAFILSSPLRYSVNSVASLVPGVVSIDGARPSFYGSRPDATAYYMDGIRMLEYEFVGPAFGVPTMKY